MSDKAAADEAVRVQRLEPAGRRWAWLSVAGALVLLGVVLHFAGALGGFERSLVEALPSRPSQALLGIVDVFKCCILSWKALTIMLPAFLLGGAIAAFVPTPVVLKYLGAGANQVRAYSVAAVSGIVLSLCSCNIVPLFVSIYRRGAGIGPAFAFLYAGPAINVVAMIFTIQVIGWRLGVWRAIGVPIVALLVGAAMALIYRREGSRQAREARAATVAVASPQADARIWLLFAALLGLVVYGAWEMAWTPKIIGMLLIAVATAGLLYARFEGDELREWMGETWGLIKLVIPVLIPAVLVIGGLAAFIDIKLVARYLGPAPEGSTFLRELRPILIGDIFGSLMYFPILSEVAFTKAFLKMSMDVGPALAVLMTGAGLSLPGAIIVARAVGWGKVLAYQALVIAFTTLFAVLFASEFGQYMCACMMME